VRDAVRLGSMSYFWVFLGGGAGAALRHGVNRAALALFGPGLPVGTLAVNVLGGFLMGVLANWFVLRGIGVQGLKLFLTTGVLGGFTTFSAFSLDAAVLWQRGDHAIFAAYVAASVGLPIGGLFLGMASVRIFS
jgi:fluoride exporter